MRAALGAAAVLVGLATTVGGVVVLALGLRRNDHRLVVVGRRAAPAALVAALLAAAAMEWALLSRDFSLVYVAENGSRSTPLLYTVASLWGALEGSILLWTLVLCGYLTVMVSGLRRRPRDPVGTWATLVGLSVAAFFFALMVGPANPFRLVDGQVPLDGPGPNPLLQNHPLMAFHPPLLYLGYVGFTIPFAYAVGSLVTGRVEEDWVSTTRRATVLAWGCLTAGIILGGWWSYEVLGWGGYWAWDPVENASLLPWLTGTAYLHSVIVQERRGMLRVWNLSLVAATFCLTILGTFLTRSGVINSVHAFTQSAIGPWLLAFLGVAAAVTIGLIAWRADALRTPGQIDAFVSREAAFLGNNLLFSAFALVVLIGTVFPLVAEAYDGRQLSVGEPYFDQMTTPIGFALLFLMAVAPALPWRASTPEVLHRRLVGPAAIAAGTMAVAVALGTRGLTPVLTWGLGSFALAGMARQLGVAVAARRRARAERWLTALLGTVAGNRRFYGGLIVHVGVVLFAVAFSLSSSFSLGREMRLSEGEATTLRGYRVTYLGAQTQRSERKTTVSVRLGVEQGGRRLGVYEPAVSQYANMTQAIGTPSVRNGLREDLYLTVVSAPRMPGDAAVIGLRVNPLVVWLWIGGAVMAAGTAVAGWPGRRVRRHPVRRRRETPPRSVPSPVGAEP